MKDYADADKIKSIIGEAKRIVIVQADNPDGDSLASALALEDILHHMGKEPTMYCGVDIPSYLSYVAGWDRVVKDLPHQFDASIIVDCSSKSLLEKLDEQKQLGWLGAKPCIVLDHHNEVTSSIDFATIQLNAETAVATGEVIYELATLLDWSLTDISRNMVAISILSDSLGLMSEGTSARSIAIISELVDAGVKLAELEEKRREMMRKSPELVRYKGQLLQRIEYFDNNRIATVTIPWEEIEKYSSAYNPTMLVIDDMRLTEGTDVAIGFKQYPDGKTTAKIRCNAGKGIAHKLAEHFGGGGHPYAAGFKIQNGRTYNEVKSECIQLANTLLDELKQEA